MIKFELGSTLAKEFAKNWNGRVHTLRMGGIALGAAFILLGATSFMMPSGVTDAFTLVISVLILALGIYGLADYFTTSIFFRRNSKFVESIFNIIIGMLLLTGPQGGMLVMFSFIIALAQFIAGLSRCFFAGKLIYFGAKNSGWTVFNGVINIIAAGLFIVMPLNPVIALTTFVGIFLIIQGLILLIDCVNSKDYSFSQSQASISASDFYEAEMYKQGK